MANKSGNSYALTLLCPILPGVPKECPEGLEGQPNVACLRYALQKVRLNQDSPMSRVPNTYLCRFYILNDVPYQGHPSALEHLKSNYLVFSSNFHGELDDYLTGMWNAVKDEVQFVLGHCVGFDKVRNVKDFIAYIKRCQVNTTFFFNGSTDEPLADQLKNLYIKQEFSKFAFENQGKSARELQQAFQAFVNRTQPGNVANPTWRAGAYYLDRVVSEK
jgi:hypothetical protein